MLDFFMINEFRDLVFMKNGSEKWNKKGNGIAKFAKS
jgi:hypothetical protein